MPPKLRPARGIAAATGAIASVSAGSCSLLSGLRAAGGRCCKRSTDSTVGTPRPPHRGPRPDPPLVEAELS
eukprot:1966658-Lingulodinium_polyedra.AAC.1